MIDENLCKDCGHKENPQRGWCYMFKDKPEYCTIWLPTHVKQAEHRANLCLKACANLSDEEVEILHTRTCSEYFQSLKAELAEARGLLEGALPFVNRTFHDHRMGIEIETFLNKGGE